jgi:hypothetical protein
LLVAVPLVATEETAECSVELVRVDLLVRLGGVLEDLANLFRNLGGLAHVDFGSLEVSSCVDKRQAAETAADLALLKGCQDDPALTLLASTTSAAKTVNVGFTVAGKTNLDYVRNIGEVHSSLMVLS